MTEEERELWRRLRRDGDVEARGFLVEQHSPWARKVASAVFRRVRVPQMEWADFVQNAMIGMLEAMARFDPDRGLDFPAYAKRRVQGAAFNGVRVFLTAVDRSALQIHRGHDRLNHLEPTECTDPLEELLDVVTGLGIGFLLESTAASASIVEVERELDHSRISLILGGALDQLADRERYILDTHYRGHVAFVDIARVLGLTKGRISQIHSAALRKLRTLLAEGVHDETEYL